MDGKGNRQTAERVKDERWKSFVSLRNLICKGIE